MCSSDLAAVAKGIFGGGLPWPMIELGAGLGVAVIVLDRWLAHTGRGFRTPVLAVAVGVYLPLELTTPIFLGGLLAALASRWHRAHGGTGEESERRDGLLYASGLIAGEAILGVLVAIPIVATGRVDVLSLPLQVPYAQWAGLLVLGVIARWLYRAAIRPAA